MKTYFVKTQSSVNEMLLHSTMKKEFATTDLAEARKAFEVEVEQLRKEYDTYDELEHSPSDKEQNHAIYCSILAIDEEGDVEYIEDSEYFYSKIQVV